jgi:hypothetical protein
LLFYSKPFLSFCWEDPKPGLPTTEIDFWATTVPAVVTFLLFGNGLLVRGL